MNIERISTAREVDAMKSVRVLLAAILSILYLVPTIAAQDAVAPAARPDDITVILDVSGSMREEAKFSSVQDYLDREVLIPLVGAGDRFTMITFGDSAAEVFSESIASDADRDRLVERIRTLSADNDFTDIGTALEKLGEVLDARKPGDARPVILFITDGKHAPPPGSPYRDKVLSLDERFRDVGRRIAMQGWLLYVIGLGDGTDAAAVAAAVEGSTLATSGPDMSGANLEGYLAGTAAVDAANVAGAAGDRGSGPGADAAPGAAVPPAPSGFALFLSSPIGLALAGLLALLALSILFLAFRPIEIRIADTGMGKRPAMVRRLGLGGSIRFNSPENLLPSIGDAGRSVFSLRRSLFGLRILVEDEQAFPKESPFGSPGMHRLKDGVLNLANGGRITITK